MTTTIDVRAQFYRYDAFGQTKWVVKRGDNPDTFARLKKIGAAIKRKFDGGFNPLYATTEGDTILLNARPTDLKQGNEQGATYNVAFQLLQKNRKNDGSAYIVIQLTKKKFISSAVAQEPLDLDEFLEGL
jgi:hypothetical protein